MSTATMPEKAYFTLQQAAHYSGISVKALRRMVAGRELTAYRPTRTILLSKAELDNLVRTAK